jgi:class 3 adenylate cyclase
VVFVDIEKYSQRRTQNQAAIVAAFTQHLRQALQKVSAQYVSYAETNDINMASDIIRLPTGDGVALVFSFDGLHDIHLQFALGLLGEIDAANEAMPCTTFAAQGWCNCHPKYVVRTGISEGRGVVFRDMNDNYNAAGEVLNSAARVMGLGDGQQILFTKPAYEQIVDMVDDVTLADRFTAYENVRIKHSHRIAVYQYVDPAVPALNSAPGVELTTMKGLEDATQNLASLMPGGGISMPDTPEHALKAAALIAEAVQAEQGTMDKLKQALAGLVEEGDTGGGDEPKRAGA